VDAHREIPFRREAQLPDERIFLSLIRQTGLPAIEADFADSGGNPLQELD
jgi:hypothetical protein